METVITVFAIIAMIILGVLLIRRLNGMHDERISAFHYSNVLPGIGRRGRKGRPSARPAGSTTSRLTVRAPTRAEDAPDTRTGEA
ncbi:hypothetical protein [Streptomyces sp. NPDC002851]